MTTEAENDITGVVVTVLVVVQETALTGVVFDIADTMVVNVAGEITGTVADNIC